MFETFVNHIVEFALTNVVWLAPFATAVTAILKRYIPAETLGSATLNTIVILVAFTGVMVADQFEYLEQFDNLMTAITAVVVALAGVMTGSAGLYKFARWVDVPVLRYSRGDYE